MYNKTVGEFFNIDKPTDICFGITNQEDSYYETEIELDPSMPLIRLYEDCMFHNLDQVREYAEPEDFGIHREDYLTDTEFQLQFEQACIDHIFGARYLFHFSEDKEIELRDDEFLKEANE